MADVLFLLDALDKQEKEQQRGRSTGRKAPRRTPIPPKPRPTSLPTPNPPVVVEPPPITPRTSDYAASTYSHNSQNTDSRRISFVELPRPAVRRLRIPTKTDSLASGFPYDPKLLKYGVTSEQWEKFSHEIVEHADVPTPSWAWRFYRKEVIQRLKKELQYDGDFKRIFKRWNKEFRRRGFEANLELPIGRGDKPYGRTVPDDASKEEKQEVKREARRFRIVISPNTNSGGSIYSRSSSLTRSVTGEGRSTLLAAGVNAAFAAAAEREAEVKEDNKDSEDDEVAKPETEGKAEAEPQAKAVEPNEAAGKVVEPNEATDKAVEANEATGKEIESTEAGVVK